jgi:hypothetical protein
MDLRLSESSAKVKVTKNQATSATSAWWTVDQPQPDSVLRTELIEVTAWLVEALVVATRQLLAAWLK